MILSSLHWTYTVPMLIFGFPFLQVLAGIRGVAHIGVMQLKFAIYNTNKFYM